MANLSMYGKNPLRSVTDYENDYLRNDVQRGLLQRNQLAMQGEQADLAIKQRAIELDNQLREVGREFGPDPKANAELIFQRTGNIKAAQDYLKSTADIGHVNAQTGEVTSKITAAQHKILMDSIGVITQSPTLPTVNSVIDRYEAQTGDKIPEIRDLFASVGDNPEQITRLAFGIGTQAEKLLPKTMASDLGGSIGLGRQDVVTGKFTPTGELPKGVSPTVAAQIASAERIGGAKPARTDPPVAVMGPDGEPILVSREDAIGKIPAGPGTKAAEARDKLITGTEQGLDIIEEMRIAYQALDDARAIPSTERSAVSNVMSSIGASGIGQTASKVVGTKEQVYRDDINSLKKRLLLAIKQATGMGAGQLNSNVELKTWLDSVSDPSQTKQSADRILDSLQKFIESKGKYTERGGRTPAPTNVPAMPAAPAANKPSVSNW